MGQFEGFYTGEETAVDNDGFLDSDTFTRRRLKREQEKAKAALLDKWKAELEQCSSRKLLKKYIETYKSETENPYVRQAEEKLDDLDFQESKVSEYALRQYIEKHPKGKHIGEAENLILKMGLAHADLVIQERKQKAEKEDIAAGICLVMMIIVFLLTFFGTDATFWEAGGAAFGAASIMYWLSRQFMGI